MAYLIRFTPKADKLFQDLPEEAKQRLDPLIAMLAEQPKPPPPLGKKLKSPPDTYRLATGPWRVVYEVHRQEILVLVVWVGDRRDAYRRR